MSPSPAPVIEPPTLLRATSTEVGVLSFVVFFQSIKSVPDRVVTKAITHECSVLVLKPCRPIKLTITPAVQVHNY